MDEIIEINCKNEKKMSKGKTLKKIYIGDQESEKRASETENELSRPLQTPRKQSTAERYVEALW